MNDLIGTIFIIVMIWFICKHRPNNWGRKEWCNGSEGPLNGGGTTGYIVQGNYHTSGTIHRLYQDAIRECDEMKQKYPEDVFFVRERRF